MPKFQLLQPTTSQLYWYEVASYVAPYATIGSFLVTAGMTFFDHSNEERHDQIMQKLEEIGQKIEELRISLERKIDDMILRERTGEVLGIREALEEYQLLKGQGILDNLISDSAATKQKVMSTLESSDTSLQYYVAYNALKCALLPLRITAFGLYNIPKANYHQLIKSELRDLLKDSSKAIANLRSIGMNRVNEGEEVIMIDELGPRFGTELWIDVDGRSVWVGSFAPPPNNLSELRQESHRVFEATQETMAGATAKEIVELYAKAQVLYDSLP